MACGPLPLPGGATAHTEGTIGMMWSKWFGNRAFYKSVLRLLIPIIVQQFISSFVSLLDNVMVGSLGAEAISAASIANTVLTVHMLAVFGGLSGASIFGAQFFG